ncbi:MAG: PEGA domain-containing protein [Opitutales bacterium]|nr:PEGA domain-containing protein [Opitutales bacterium]
MKRFYAMPAILTLALSLILGACKSGDEIYTRDIFIDSAPQGATVIVNGIALSKTPLTLNVGATDGGCFLIPTQIILLAPNKDTHTQIISYPAYKPGNEDISRIPETLNFDMSVPTAENK